MNDPAMPLLVRAIDLVSSLAGFLDGLGEEYRVEEVNEWLEEATGLFVAPYVAVDN